MSDAKLPIFHTAWLSFRDGWRAARAMPKLTAITFVLIFVESIVALLLKPDKSEGLLVWQQLAQVALGVLSSLLATPLCIAFYRYLLLGEVTRRYALDISSPRVQAYFGYYVVLFLAVWLVTTAGFYLSETSGPLTNEAGLGMAFLVMLFAALLFPAVAVDAPKANLGNALGDLHPLRAFTIGFVVLLPCYLVPLVLGFVFLLLYVLLSGELLTPDTVRVAGAAIFIVFWSIWFMTLLALSAHFYRAWARRLGRPPGTIGQV